MRSSLSIILLLLLFFQAMLLLPLTRISLELHQEEVEESLKEDEEGEKGELLELSFTEREIRHELDWKEKNEFQLHGMMYDVVAAEREKGRIVLTVYKDREETSIRSRNEALRKGSSQGEQDEKEKRGFRSFSFKYLKSRASFFHIPRTCKLLRSSYASDMHQEAFLRVPVPPPC